MLSRDPNHTFIHETTMSRIKNTLDGINYSLDITEEKIKLEDIAIETTQNKQRKTLKNTKIGKL